jgi:1-acyl-sn-glycerol-3-phosphate acyltransferase
MPFKDIFEHATYQTMRLVARALAAGRLQLAVKGLPHIPKHGPVLLVARHYHHLFDGVVLLVSMPRPIHILVTLDWAKNSYARHLMTLATRMARWPVVLRSDALRASVNRDRTSREKISTAAAIRRYQRSALSNSVALLAEGRVLVVFPEGYPNIDPHHTPKARPEEFLPFKAGFATIAAAAEKRLGARVPIVPSGFRYTKNNRWTARLNIGEAVYLEDFVSRQLLVSYMEQRVAELSGLLAGGQP